MRRLVRRPAQRDGTAAASASRDARLAVVGSALALFLVGAALPGCRGLHPRAELEASVQRYVQMWNTGRFDGVDRLLTGDFELRESPGFEPGIGIRHFQETVRAVRRSYPDFHLIVNKTVYGRDRVAAIWTIRATNTGPGPRPPTGKAVEVTGMSVIDFRDGRISGEWIAGNEFEWYRQLGYELVPAAASASR